MQQPVPTVVIVGLLSVSVVYVLETEAIFLCSQYTTRGEAPGRECRRANGVFSLSRHRNVITLMY